MNKKNNVVQPFGYRCADCGKMNVKSSKCSKCKNASYCDEICQKKNWLLHKSICLGDSGLLAKKTKNVYLLFSQLLREHFPVDQARQLAKYGYVVSYTCVIPAPITKKNKEQWTESIQFLLLRLRKHLNIRKVKNGKKKFVSWTQKKATS